VEHACTLVAAVHAAAWPVAPGGSEIEHLPVATHAHFFFFWQRFWLSSVFFHGCTSLDIAPHCACSFAVPSPSATTHAPPPLVGGCHAWGGEGLALQVQSIGVGLSSPSARPLMPDCWQYVISTFPASVHLVAACVTVP
jgi:hypothetical protein